MKKIHWIGIGALLLAAFLIVSLVFIPRIVQKSEMEALLALSVAPDPMTVVIGDPLLDLGDPLGNKGKECLLSGESANRVQNLLRALSESGYRLSHEEKKPSGAWDLQVRVKAANGETARLWLTEDGFYYMKDTLAVCFTAKDQEAYTAAYLELRTILEAA